jgi:hypothetical protein
VRSKFPPIRVGDDIYGYVTHATTHVDVPNPSEPEMFVRVERLVSVTYRNALGDEIVVNLGEQPDDQEGETR